MWHKKLGVGYGICSISQGRLFQFDRYRDKARLTCMKPETGDEVWRFEYSSVYDDMLGYDNGPRCCPVVDGDRVYTFGVEGMLYCVRVADGKEIWKVDTAKDFGVVQNFFGVGSTPLVEGDLLIVNVGGSPPDSPREVCSGRVFGKDSGIVAFDKRTGAVRYRISDELASYSSPVAATIDGRRVCFCLCRGGFWRSSRRREKSRFITLGDRRCWRASTPRTRSSSGTAFLSRSVTASAARCCG